MKLSGRTYTVIGKELGISRQRAQQLISPPRPIRNLIVARAGGLCQHCEAPIGRAGHVHHTGNNGEDYNDVANLILLCPGCHMHAHQDTSRGTDKNADTGAGKGVQCRIPADVAQWILAQQQHQETFGQTLTRLLRIMQQSA